MKHCKTCRCLQQRIFVFDSPRTCSLLFYRLFAGHDDIRQCFFPYANAGMLGPERIGSLETEDETLADSNAQPDTDERYQNETYHLVSERLGKWVTQNEDSGKVPWMKDHTLLLIKHSILFRLLRNEQMSPTEHVENPTHLPDAFFDSLTPILLIRHPALAIPSFYRKQLPFWNFPPSAEPFKLYTTNRFTRLIFDTYCARRHARSRADRAGMPIVVNAKDLVWNTQKTVEKLCDILDLDKRKVRYEWDSVEKDDWEEWIGGSECLMQLAPFFFGEALGSKGVIRKGGGPGEEELDLDVEMGKWEAEFGGEGARGLRERVEEDMGNWEYLKKHSLMNGMV